MKNRWKILISTFLCLALAAALVPSAAAATIVQGAKQVLLDESDVASEVYFEGIGENLGLMMPAHYDEETGVWWPGHCIEVYQMDASGNIVAVAPPSVIEESVASSLYRINYNYEDNTTSVVDQSGQVVLGGGEKYHFLRMLSDDLVWARDAETGNEGALNLFGAPATAFEDGYDDIEPLRNGYCSAKKYSSISGMLYGFVDFASGGFFGSDTWHPLSDVSSAGMVWVNDGTPNSARLVTVAELENHSVTFIPDPEYDYSDYVIEEPVNPHLSRGEDQVFTLDDAEDNTEEGLGSNYERFQDLYFDGIKLVGGKVAAPELADMNWDYFAEEGSTRLTVRSKVFADKPAGVHQLSATFKSLDSESEVDTVTQYFEIMDAKQEVVPASPDGLKVNDVVNFTGTVHYYTAYATHPEPCKPGPATVTRIFDKGTHNIHLIAVPGMGSNVYGWVDASTVYSAQPAQSEQSPETVQPVTSAQFAKGDRVTVKRGALTYEGIKLANYVYDNIYTVIQVRQGRVVIGINGVATAAMRAEDLVAVN